MKCTQCGNTSLIGEVTYFKEAPDGGVMDRNLKTFVCDKCGHLEQFYMKPIEKKKELDDLKEEFDKDTLNLRESIEFAEKITHEYNTKIRNYINDETKRLKEIIDNKSNTVMVNEKAKSDLKTLKILNVEQTLKRIGLSIVDYPDRRQQADLKRRLAKKQATFDKTVQEINKRYKIE